MVFMLIRLLQYHFSYLSFAGFFEGYKEAIPCLSKRTARIIKLFLFCYFILTRGGWNCPQFWHSDGSLFLLIIPTTGFSWLSTELPF